MSNATRLIVVETALTPRHEALLYLLSSNPSPGMAAMRRATGLKTDRGVQLLVRRLAEHGWITVTESGGGRGNWAVYRTLRNPEQKPRTTPNEKGEKPRTETPNDPSSEPRVRALVGFDFGVDLDLKDQVKDLKTNTTASDEDFVAWYADYPKQIDRKNAQCAWRNLTRSEQRGAVEGLPRWVEYWRSENTAKQFIPAPAVWLHRRRWESETPHGVIAPALTNPLYCPSEREINAWLEQGLDPREHVESMGYRYGH